MHSIIPRNANSRIVGIGLAALLMTLLLIPSHSPLFAQEPNTPLQSACIIPNAGSVPQCVLTALGMSPAGTSIASNQYVRLVVGIYIPGAESSVTMDECPDRSVWDIDFRSLTHGDSHITFGAQITSPDAATPISYTPLDFTRTAAGVLGLSHNCKITINNIIYQSPLYFVRLNSTQQFTIDSAYASTTQLNSQIQGELNTFLAAATAAAGVPAVTAAPFLAGGKLNLIPTTAVTNSQDFIQHLQIQAGSVKPPFVWIIPGAIPKTHSQPARDIDLLAQLVPVSAIIDQPSQGAPWTSSYVLNTRFYVSSAAVTAGSPSTLGNYLSAFASKQISDYQTASGSAIEADCSTLFDKIDSVGLSDRDGALAKWAEAEQRVGKQGVTEADVDNMACLNGIWPQLKALGMNQLPQKPTEVASAPTMQQMKGTVVDDLWYFTNDITFAQKKPFADNLFSYVPNLVYGDPTGAMMKQSAPISDSDGWAVNSYSADAPILSHLGCYVYFDINKDSSGVAKSFGSRSMMTAIGQVANGGSSYSGKEVALEIFFAPTVNSAGPKINEVDILTELPPTLKTILKAASGQQSCSSGYKPQMIYGAP